MCSNEVTEAGGIMSYGNRIIDEMRLVPRHMAMDTAGSSGLETRAHAECEVKRLKAVQIHGIQAAPSINR